MSKGFVFDADGKTLTFPFGDRTVMSAAGVMVSLLPTMETFTGKTLTFPDFSKDNLYIWAASSRVAFSTKGDRENAFSYITALPQEYSHKTVLMDAPDGSDFFLGQFRFSRTTAPASTWRGRTLAVLPAEDQWTATTGSALMEAETNMCRALHIYLDDDPGSGTYRKLVMEAEQSVGPPPGGWTTQIGDGDGLNWVSAIQAVNASNTASGDLGTPVSFRGGFSYGPVNSSWSSPFLSASALATTLRHDGSNPNKPSRVDNTNYTSIYSVDIRGRFGRRS